MVTAAKKLSGLGKEKLVAMAMSLPHFTAIIIAHRQITGLY